jgi:hypothetical protein
MIHPDTILRQINDRIGLGVVVTRPIPRGTIVWLRDALDQVISPERAAALPEQVKFHLDLYGYQEDDNIVLLWDNGRFVNHSCQPSTISIGSFAQVARRDLDPGEEITCEYADDQYKIPFTCTCGAPGCHGGSPPGPTQARSVRLDEEAAAAYASALEVPQPLLEAAIGNQPGAWIFRALRDKRPLTLPSSSAPTSLWRDGPRP